MLTLDAPSYGHSTNPRIYACGHKRLPVRDQLDYPSSETTSGRRQTAGSSTGQLHDLHGGANRQTMVLSQTLRSPGDPSCSQSRSGRRGNKQTSTSCASRKTATMMTRSNTWNLAVLQKMSGGTRFFRLWISPAQRGPRA